MPPKRWPTEFHYANEGLEQADATDFVCVNHVIAHPWRHCFPVSPVDIIKSEDLLFDEELSLVERYMYEPFHDRVSHREEGGQHTAWWQLDIIVSRS